jgi:hypothetical protein
MKLLGIISVGFNVTDQLLIRSFAFVVVDYTPKIIYKTISHAG